MVLSSSCRCHRDKLSCFCLLWVFSIHVIHHVLALSTSKTAATTKSKNEIRAISFDVTGTLLATKEPVLKSYHEAAIWAELPNPPSMEELKPAFKAAYKQRCLESPCFGGVEEIPGREWWRRTVRTVLEQTGRQMDKDYTSQDFDRYFRRVYQHFGSPNGYRVLDDAQALLDRLSEDYPHVLLGITSNTPTRHMESVLPMLNIHDYFKWFTCSQDVRQEKPAPAMFDNALQQANVWFPEENPLLPCQILHIGDSLACDFCGAKAFGMQALLLDRSQNPAVTAYQDWIEAPDYPGKTQEDTQENTITDLLQVLDYLQSA